MVIAALLPQDSIVIDESVSSSAVVQRLCQGAAPHQWLSHTSGALGLGLPMSVGASIACPDRKTLCLMGDGAAMCTPQALWTQAREELDVITIVFSNRTCAILDHELKRIDASPAPAALAMLDLAIGMGVEACRVDTAETFASALTSALANRGPRLIELALTRRRGNSQVCPERPSKVMGLALLASAASACTSAEGQVSGRDMLMEPAR